MPEGSPLRQALVKLINEVLAEQSAAPGSSNVTPVQGTCVVVNDDGTIDVMGNDGNYYASVGYPDVQVTMGQVVLVVSDGVQQAAIPYVAPGGSQINEQ